MQNQNHDFSKYIAHKYGFSEQFDRLGTSINALLDTTEKDIIDSCNNITCGKMIRPVVLFLFGMLNNGKLNSKHIEYASIIEIIHYASLVHDDIIDNAHTRRDTANIRSKKGDNFAVILGDWLISRVFSKLLSTGCDKASACIAQTVQAMCEGEMLQNKHLFTKIDEELYFKIITLKTAKLYECSCKLGSLFSEANLKDDALCSDFGLNFGIAFQIINDIKDFETAKKDIKNGQNTLPSLRMSKFDCPQEAVNSSLITANEYLEKAVDSLGNHKSCAADGLKEICEHFKPKL